MTIWFQFAKALATISVSITYAILTQFVAVTGASFVASHETFAATADSGARSLPESGSVRVALDARRVHWLLSHRIHDRCHVSCPPPSRGLKSDGEHTTERAILGHLPTHLASSHCPDRAFFRLEDPSFVGDFLACQQCPLTRSLFLLEVLRRARISGIKGGQNFRNRQDQS